MLAALEERFVAIYFTCEPIGSHSLLTSRQPLTGMIICRKAHRLCCACEQLTVNGGSAAVIGLCAAVNLDDNFVGMGKAQDGAGAFFEIVHVHRGVRAVRLQARNAIFHLFPG